MTLKLMRRPPPTVFSFSFSPVRHESALAPLRLTLPTVSLLAPQNNGRQIRACRDRLNQRYFSNLSRRCLAHVRDERSINDIVWFTSTQPLTYPPSSPLDGFGKAGDGRQQPDERTLRLGKSERTKLSPFLRNRLKTNTHTPSNTNPPHSPARPPRQSSPPRNPLPANNTPPLPINAPTPPHRLRQNRIQRRPLDLSLIHI